MLLKNISSERLEDIRDNTLYEQKIYSVSELSMSIKLFVEANFEIVKVKGEVQDCKVHSSGHVYFVLKDGDAIIDAICWKGTYLKSAMKLEDGLEIICNARVTTYPMRSKYQIILNSYEIFGQGALLKLIEERKKRLLAAGVFSNNRKLPFLPKKIGVITSLTGAVIRDIVQRIKARNDTVNMVLWPVTVQGVDAVEEIIAAIDGFNKIDDRPEILIVARGGGALEDLMPFNDESLCHAIFNSKIPVITAIGHETDTTLADFASDLRASTPTAAAEISVPVKLDLLIALNNVCSKLVSLCNMFLQKKQLNVNILVKSLPSMKSFLMMKFQTLDHFQEKLHLSMLKLLQDNFKKIEFLSILLESCSYKNVLNRGFSLVTLKNGDVVKSVYAVEDEFDVQFYDGKISVKKV